MSDECRRYRESLGSLALDRLSSEERREIEAHLEHCAVCTAEARSLERTAGLLPLVDPANLIDAPPSPPPGLERQIEAQIHAERDSHRVRRRRFVFSGFAAAGATVAAVLVIALSGSQRSQEPQPQDLTFSSLPAGIAIDGSLRPKTTGTEIRLNVSGVRSGTLCRVYVRRTDGKLTPAGSFRYRYDDADQPPVLSTGVDLSQIRQVEVKAGPQTFVQPVGS